MVRVLTGLTKRRFQVGVGDDETHKENQRPLIHRSHHTVTSEKLPQSYVRRCYAKRRYDNKSSVETTYPEIIGGSFLSDLSA